MNEIKQIQPTRSFIRRFWWITFIPFLLVLIILIIVLVGKISKDKKSAKSNVNVYKISTSGSKCTDKAAPDPATDYFTWTLPDCASDLRLHFPYTMNELFYSNNTGLTGYGVHAGEHIEGLNHEWIDLKGGTPIRSWADGEVERVEISGDIETSEVQIKINYGHNLIGVHMEVARSLVKKGDKVKAGQEIAVGFTKGNEKAGEEITSAEYALIDLNRNDGVFDFGQSPSTVSPYDYLNPEDKAELIAAYKKHYIEPYLAGENVSLSFHPEQPYLTNQLFGHIGNTGKLSGEWYSTENSSGGDPENLITFIEADNPYYKGNLVLTRNNNLSNAFSGVQGKFEVDYINSRIKITEDNINIGDNPNNGKVYYGIFEINEPGERSTLKLELQRGKYPTSFSSNAKTYIVRDNGFIKTQNH